MHIPEKSWHLPSLNNRTKRNLQGKFSRGRQLGDGSDSSDAFLPLPAFFSNQSPLVSQRLFAKECFPHIFHDFSIFFYFCVFFFAQCFLPFSSPWFFGSPLLAPWPFGRNDSKNQDLARTAPLRRGRGGDPGGRCHDWVAGRQVLSSQKKQRWTFKNRLG